MSNQIAYCTITVHRQGPKHIGPEFSVEVQSSYDPDFVTALKKISHLDRRYDPEEKLWYFKSQYLEILKKLAVDHFPRAILVQRFNTLNLHTGQLLEQRELFGEDEEDG